MLITLVIIGVVTAITIPAVLQNTERQETVSKLKKAYSVLQQATIKIATDEGLTVGDFSLMSEDEFFDKFAKVVNTTKICKKASGCFSNEYLKSLDGNNWAVYNRANSLITADGVAFGWNKEYCHSKGLSQEDEKNCIGRFIVDLNGSAPPNRFGYDIFFFQMVKNKGAVPAGSANHDNCKRRSNGVTCAAVVLSTEKIDYQ